MTKETSSAAMQLLLEKIEQKTLRTGIIGLGYVGLPLAIEFARAGLAVTGIDVSARKVESIAKSKSYIEDVREEELGEAVASGRLKSTTDFSVIAELDAINICVPTPLRKSKDPDMSYVIAAVEEIAKYLHKGMLIILESTTYPGTTEEVILPTLEEKGLTVGKDFFLAFSPERIDPGNVRYHTRNIPKVVGGVTPDCTKLAAAYYSVAIDEVHTVSSPRAAEMVKLLENTFRSVNIALVNELCQMSEKLGVNVWEIIDAAATKPFGFMPFYPGPGLGGHCIPIDPHYLAWKARSSGLNPKFIDLADQINSAMPDFVAHKAQNILNEQSKSIKGSRIHLLGMSYKKNVSDVRESPALFIMQLLLQRGAVVTFSEPHVTHIELDGNRYDSLPVSEVSKADLTLLVTDHSVFDLKFILDKSKLILDTRNAFKEFVSDKIYKI